MVNCCEDEKALTDLSGRELGCRRCFKNVWRPVRESNPCRRREREATYCNSMELRGMDSTLPHLRDSRGTLIGRLMDARFPWLSSFFRLLVVYQRWRYRIRSAIVFVRLSLPECPRQHPSRFRGMFGMPRALAAAGPCARKPAPDGIQRADSSD